MAARGRVICSVRLPAAGKDRLVPVGSLAQSLFPPAKRALSIRVVALTEAVIPEMTREERHADLIATQNIAGFQERINAETDEGKYRVLARLLANEFRKLEKMGTSAV